MEKVAIIGAGVSGLSLAKMLDGKAEVTLFEQKQSNGGLISCIRVQDVLYHKVGGHVFNSKNKDVLNWFWNFFDKETEFVKAKRHAKILLDGKTVGYPIENYIYQLDNATIIDIINDLLSQKNEPCDNFEDFLIQTFGKTLYNLYFKPYNNKIWNVDLSEVPLEWLDGKLPMPNLGNIIFNNIARDEEKDMVHASFYYPKNGGSQFIIDRLSVGLKVVNDFALKSISIIEDKKLCINDSEIFDRIIYTGDLRNLPDYLVNSRIDEYNESIKALKSNGTTNILCSCDPTDLSWMYIPEAKYKAHRIIYTGNFSDANNNPNIINSCTVEFSNFATLEEVQQEMKNLPGNLRFIAYNYEPNSYVIQDMATKHLIKNVKGILAQDNIYLLGRFAEWEYYNMDKCIEAAMELVSNYF